MRKIQQEEAVRQAKIREEQEREQARLNEIKRVEKAKQAAETKKMWDELRAKRDPDDVVAQVLNYTTSGSDEGTDMNFWLKEKECVYRHISLFTLNTKANQIARALESLGAFRGPFKGRLGPNAGTGAGAGVIDLNSLDPQSISIGEKPVWDGSRYAGVTTVLLYEGRVLVDNKFNTMAGGFFGGGQGRQDKERLARGWALIYSDYCKGIKKAF